VLVRVGRQLRAGSDLPWWQLAGSQPPLTCPGWKLQRNAQLRRNYRRHARECRFIPQYHPAENTPSLHKNGLAASLALNSLAVCVVGWLAGCFGLALRCLGLRWFASVGWFLFALAQLCWAFPCPDHLTFSNWQRDRLTAKGLGKGWARYCITQFRPSEYHKTRRWSAGLSLSCWRGAWLAGCLARVGVWVAPTGSPLHWLL
jgi:hypothetical protein